MIKIFKNKFYFAVVFFSVLFIDIYVKLVLEAFPYRYISKPIVMASIFLFYIYNRNIVDRKKCLFFSIGIICFLVGDVFLINDANQVFFMIGMFCFILGKFFYILRFSNEKDFSIIRLVPFLIVSFVYVLVLLRFIYDGLGSFFFPIVVYYFISQLLLLMAYLRLNAVDYSSYLLIFIGVISFVVSETIVALSIFHVKMGYQDAAIMLFYGVSQLLIVYGIVSEKELNEDEDENMFIY